MPWTSTIRGASGGRRRVLTRACIRTAPTSVQSLLNPSATRSHCTCASMLRSSNPWPYREAARITRCTRHADERPAAPVRWSGAVARLPLKRRQELVDDPGQREQGDRARCSVSMTPHAGDDPFRGDHDVQGGLDRPSSERLLQHAAEYVDRISRRAKPGDLPRGPQLRPRTSMIDCRPWSAVVSAAGYCRPLLLT